MNTLADCREAVLVECELPEPPEQVWRALTEPHLLAQWLMPSDMQPQVGHEFRFEPAPEEGTAAVDCEVLASEPHRMLSLRWRPAGRGSAHSDDEPATRDDPGTESAPGQEGPQLRPAPEQEAPGASIDSIVTFELTRTPAGGTHLRLVHSHFTRRSSQTYMSAQCFLRAA